MTEQLITNTGQTDTIFANEYETVYVCFKDINGINVAVTNPTVQIFKENILYSTEPLNAILGQIGWYKCSFWTTPKFSEGLYDLVFTGTFNSEILTKKGQIIVGEITATQDFINRLRNRLMDNYPEYYLIDETVYQWHDNDLFKHLQDALNKLNLFPPLVTFFTFDNVPNSSLVLDIAQYYALLARARLENANTFSYSDGISLNISRAQFLLSEAQALQNLFMQELKAFKFMLRSPIGMDWPGLTPVGLRRSRLPFRVMRVLGFLPNMKRLFSLG